MSVRVTDPTRFFKSFAIVSAAGVWVSAQAAPMALAIDLSTGHASPFQVESATTVEFEFVESHGAYQSSFGILDVETGERTILFAPTRASDNIEPLFVPSSYLDDYGLDLDFLGSPGISVDRALAEFMFLPNRSYTFFLESTHEGRDAGTVYFLDLLNPNSERLALLEEAEECEEDGSYIFWDDTGSLLVNESEQDRDFDDYIIKVTEDCPILGLGLPPAPEAAIAALPAGGGSLGGLGALGLLPLAALLLTGDSEGGGGNNNITQRPPDNPPLPPTPPPPPEPSPPPPPPPPPEEDVPFNFHPGFGLITLGLFWWERRRRRRLSK